jgi:hypothetical protein
MALSFVSNAMRNAYASHTDFGFLRGVILENPKAMPSNIDMVFERRGNFLIGEWKREDEDISLGQKILLKALADQDKFTVLVINGYSDNTGTEVDKFYKVTEDKLVILGNGIEGLKDYIDAWYQSSNGVSSL